MPKKIAGVPALDATLPTVSLEVGGKTYHLCYTFAALSLAQAELDKRSARSIAEYNRALKESVAAAKAIQLVEPVNVFDYMDFTNIDPRKLEIMLYVALLLEQPDITPEAAKALIQMGNIRYVIRQLSSAYVLSMPEPETKKNPPGEPA